MRFDVSFRQSISAKNDCTAVASTPCSTCGAGRSTARSPRGVALSDLQNTNNQAQRGNNTQRKINTTRQNKIVKRNGTTPRRPLLDIRFDSLTECRLDDLGQDTVAQDTETVPPEALDWQSRARHNNQTQHDTTVKYNATRPTRQTRSCIVTWPHYRQRSIL